MENSFKLPRLRQVDFDNTNIIDYPNHIKDVLE